MTRGTSDIARRLLKARRALGVSQRELSRRSGLTQAQISRIENGMVDMRVSSLLTLATELGLELTLAERSGPPRRRPASPKSRRPALGEQTIRRPGIFGDIAEELL